jgi:putative tryptophan/tyrosine transport system substrate-binding protein
VLVNPNSPETIAFGTGAFMNSHRERLAALAAHYRLPAIFSLREFSAAGGLMSRNQHNRWIPPSRELRRAHTQRREPADLPAMQSTKFELVINLKTAKALGLEIPDKLLARADEVIE